MQTRRQSFIAPWRLEEGQMSTIQGMEVNILSDLWLPKALKSWPWKMSLRLSVKTGKRASAIYRKDTGRNKSDFLSWIILVTRCNNFPKCLIR